MYKNTDRQASLLDVTSTMGESARRRLKSSWAHAFVRDVYPILLEVETKFAHLYGTTGQPNRSVARLLGVCILQENQDLTDQQAVDALTFDARWRYSSWLRSSTYRDKGWSSFAPESRATTQRASCSPRFFNSSRTRLLRRLGYRRLVNGSTRA